MPLPSGRRTSQPYGGYRATGTRVRWYPLLYSPRGAHRAEISIQICAMAWVFEPRTFHLAVQHPTTQPLQHRTLQNWWSIKLVIWINPTQCVSKSLKMKGWKVATILSNKYLSSSSHIRNHSLSARERPPGCSLGLLECPWTKKAKPCLVSLWDIKII